MIVKAQWVVLPAGVSPPGVVPQLGQRPEWIVDYSWSLVNNDTLNLPPRETMQFCHTLDKLLREILLASPNFCPVELIKVDLSDIFYPVSLNVEEIPKLGVAFPT